MIFINNNEYANGDRNALCDLHLYDTEMDKNVNKNILLYNNAAKLLGYGIILFSKLNARSKSYMDLS